MIRATTRLIVPAIALASLAFPVHADILKQFELASGQWSYDVSGTVRDRNDDVDFSGLSGGDNDQPYYRLGLIFDSPWVPDLLIESQDLEAGAMGQTDGGLLLPGASGSAFADFDSLSASITYPLIDDGVRLGIGVQVEQLDGTVTRREDGGVAETDDYDETIPLAYLRADVVPFGPITLRGELAYVRSGSDRVIHSRFSLLWPVIAPLGLEFGIQSRRYRFETDSFDVDADLTGGYAGLLFKF